jgi:hypothetical protein
MEAKAMVERSYENINQIQMDDLILAHRISMEKIIFNPRLRWFFRCYP